MTRAEMLAELREVIHDTTLSVGWGDAVLVGYLAEGQDKFCEETGYFRDATNYTVTLQTDTARYDISDRIIQVLHVWDGMRRLGKIHDDRVVSNDDWPATISVTAGLPTHWRTDKETGAIEFYPTPTSDYDERVMTLQVWRYSRYPLDRMSSTITLTGSLHAGDVITATVNGAVYSYAVLGSEGSLSAVAAALAAVIDASTDLVATASGQVVAVSALLPEVSTSTTTVVSGEGATVTATAADVYSASPEIVNRLQRACVEWAAYKALMHHDSETQDPIKASEHLAAFNAYVLDGIRQFRRKHNQETWVGTDPAYRT